MLIYNVLIYNYDYYHCCFDSKHFKFKTLWFCFLNIINVRFLNVPEEQKHVRRQKLMMMMFDRRS